ncbi:gastrula zinc finger protein xlcgf46.1: PROVISIONAL [Gigaspora margarita]|uniref:Gastrula zinc finger protein xlcgf46.1: PROVISIONAL n=1 Tax=Gigaspora margarita TaxID=4874 RepID=A0A8H4EMU8_GIGMA|nr:gastrula zinc finger protein xlcgf46.1: PROVISIONAL [Gigaspora margarita]
MSDAYPEYIEEFSIEIADFNPIGPTAYIPLPETLPKRNNGIINIQNDDDWCFEWSVLGALHPVKIHPERNPHRLYGGFIEELNMEDIPIPVPVSTPVYKKFEENNPEISLCVYEWHNQNEFLEFRYISERRRDEYKQVNLLVITEEDRSHYCIIKDLHKLAYNYSKHKGRKYLCRYCLHVYSAEKGLKEHIPKCKGLNNAPQQSQMPIKDRSVKAFYNHKCMQPNPYRIFWDLECLTENLTPEEKTKLTNTERIQMHKPCGYCYVVVRMDSFLNYEVMSYDLYRGPDALEKFVTKIEEELANIQEDLSAPAEMIMAPGDLETYNKATDCWICKGPFIKPSPEVLQQFEEAKHRLLELKEWEACIEKDHPEKKKIQKGYQEALSALNHKVIR